MVVVVVVVVVMDRQINKQTERHIDKFTPKKYQILERKRIRIITKPPPPPPPKHVQQPHGTRYKV